MDRQKIVQSLRIVYHGFGPQAFFTDSSYIANALNSSAPESKGAINVLCFAIEAGVGKLYLPLIMNKQVPDHEFVNEAVNYLAYNGLSADSARFAVNILNETLGWRVVPAPVVQESYNNSNMPVEYDNRAEMRHADRRADRQRRPSQDRSQDGYQDDRAQDRAQDRAERKSHKEEHENKSRKPKKDRGISFGGVLKSVLIFVISVAIGFGGAYLFFNYKKIFSGSKETTPTTNYTAVDNLVYKVTAKGTPVFSKEDVNSATVAVLDKGDKVTVTAQGAKFSAVTLANGVTGYIQNEKISLAV